MQIEANKSPVTQSTDDSISDYPSQEFGSIDELCSLISAGTSDWHTDTYWYRGVQQPAYTLQPKIFRDNETRQYENYIAVEFRRRARARLNDIRTPFEWLCAMQHYGLPTRLLDWTENLSVALYFTILPVGPTPTRPTIWVLDPYEFHGYTNNDPDIVQIASEKVVQANADLAFNDNANEFRGLTTKHPIPVAPDFLFDRLAIQNCSFTLHGENAVPIDKLIPVDKRSMLLKFVAKEGNVEQIMATLRLIVPSSDALFPDLEGIRNSIISSY